MADARLSRDSEESADDLSVEVDRSPRQKASALDSAAILLEGATVLDEPDALGAVLDEPRAASRVLRWVVKTAQISLTSALVCCTVVGSLAADPPILRSSRLASRKAPATAGARSAGEELETLATLVNAHTGETFALSADEPSQSAFSATLSDRVTGSRISLDPKLLDLLRQIARRNPGARIELVSGFRSPKLNEMLRKKGHNVASRSQHSLGHACDFRIVGYTPKQMKEELLALGWPGGIGRYDKSSDWFVHADVGPKREWFER